MEKIYENLIDKCILNLSLKDKKGVLETWKKYRDILEGEEDKLIVTGMIKWLVRSTKKKKK